jgi:hypothetical protein
MRDTTMSPDELRPRDGETFYGWLARVDAPTAAYAQRDHHSNDEEIAYRRGTFAGELNLLFRLYGALHDGVRDAELLVGMMAAGILALKRRRSALDFRIAMEHETQTNDEVRELRSHDSPDSTEGGPDGQPPAA